MDMNWIDIRFRPNKWSWSTNLQRELWLAGDQRLLRENKFLNKLFVFCWSIKRAVIGWCPKFVEAQTRSDFFTELRLSTCQPAALLSSCLFFLVHFFRKQIWQIGKIATCLEIFSDSFLIHSKSRNDDTPSSLICAALPANYPRPVPPVYPFWFSFKPFCPSLFEHVQYPKGGGTLFPLKYLGVRWS